MKLNNQNHNIIKFNNLKLNILFSILLIFVLNSCQITDKEIHLYIQKGQPLSNYFIQYNIGQGGIMDKPLPDFFTFEYNNNYYKCFIIQEVIGSYMSQSGGSSYANGKWVDYSTRSQEYITKNYYVLTDTKKENIIIDGFYKFQIMNGTKSKYYIDMFKQMNKKYLENLIKYEVYTKEDIDNMTDVEKSIYLELN